MRPRYMIITNIVSLISCFGEKNALDRPQKLEAKKSWKYFLYQRLKKSRARDIASSLRNLRRRTAWQTHFEKIKKYINNHSAYTVIGWKSFSYYKMKQKNTLSLDYRYIIETEYFLSACVWRVVKTRMPAPVKILQNLKQLWKLAYSRLQNIHSCLYRNSMETRMSAL